MKKWLKSSNNWDLFFELVRTDFKVRYNNSILGFLWVLLKPFLIFSIIFLVFSFFFKSQDPNYYLNLLLGILLFSYFSEGTVRGLTSLTDKSNIILKINFPRFIAVLAPIVNSLINFIAGFFVFLIFWITSNAPLSIFGLVYFLGLVILLSLFIIGFTLFGSILYIKLRDLYSIWEVALQLLFYATPIIYPLNFIPGSLQRLILLNPLATIIIEGRSALINPTPTHYKALIYSIIITAILIILGYLFFKKNIRRVAEYF